MNTIRCLASFLLVPFWIGVAVGAEDPAKPPNVVLIIGDDQAWTDFGFMGHADIQTPHLDRLAGEGVELDQHYVAPMCTPTRAALLTGRYWGRFGNTNPSNERVLPWRT